MKSLLFIVFLLLASLSVSAQVNFSNVWITNLTAQSNNLKYTHDSCFIVTTNCRGNAAIPGLEYPNCYLMKVNSLGHPLWAKRWPFANHDYSGAGEANPVCETRDYGFAVSGVYANDGTQPLNTNEGIFLVRTDSLGDLLWAKTYNLGNNVRAESVIETANHNYVICGKQGSNTQVQMAFILMADSLGTMLWAKTFQTTLGGECFERIIEATNGDLIACGRFNDGSMVVRTDSIGTPIWTAVDTTTWSSVLFDLLEAPNGDIVTCGYGPYQLATTLVTRLTAAGTPIWSYGYTRSNLTMYNDEGRSIVREPDGFSIGFEATPNGGLLRIDDSGQVVTCLIYQNLRYPGFELVKTVDGYAIAAGSIYDIGGPNQQSGLGIQKMDSTGFNCNAALVVNTRIPHPIMHPISIYELPVVTVQQNWNLQVVPTAMVYYVLCPDPVSVVEPEVPDAITIGNDLMYEQLVVQLNFPSEKATVHLINPVGQEIDAQQFTAGQSNQIRFSTADLPNGIYLILVECDGQISGSQKAIIVR